MQSAGVQVSAYGSQGQLLHGALQRSKQERSCEVSGYQDPAISPATSPLEQAVFPYIKWRKVCKIAK